MAPRKEKSEHIKVCIRARPLSRGEQQRDDEVHTMCNSLRNEVRLPMNGKVYTFGFDEVFGPETKQTELYETVMIPIIDDVMSGFNASVFAYGQTGTGKTFTMEGDESFNANTFWNHDNQAGLIPRTLQHIFSELNERGTNYSVKVSFVQLYNEEIHDLLNDGSDIRKLKLYEQKGSIIIDGVKEMELKDNPSVFQLLDQGRKRRKTAATLLNDNSSRSHTVFMITVETSEIFRDPDLQQDVIHTTKAKLNLIDLAGSESVGRSGALAHETGQINKSLLTLGRVISSLASADRPYHIPYRESCLTRILQDSLGGGSKACIIATIVPAQSAVDETYRTLDFACKAKAVTNRPEIHTQKQVKIKEPLPASIIVPDPIPDFHDINVRSLLGMNTPDAVILQLIDKCTMNTDLRTQFVAESERVYMAVHDDIRKYNQFFARFSEEHHLRLRAEKQNRRNESVISTQKRNIAGLELNVQRLERESSAQSQVLRRDANKFANLYNIVYNSPVTGTPLRKANSHDDVVASGRGVFRQQNNVSDHANQGNNQPSASHAPLGGTGRLYPKLSNASSAASAAARTPRRIGPPVPQKPPSSARRARAPSPPPRTGTNRPHMNRKFHRRSRSTGGININHQPSVPVPSGQVNRLDIGGRVKTTTSVKSSDLRAADTYALTHEDADSEGCLRTNVFKGNVIPTAGGGTAVCYTDMETVQHNEPALRKRTSSEKDDVGNQKRTRL